MNLHGTEPQGREVDRALLAFRSCVSIGFQFQFQREEFGDKISSQNL